MAVCIVGGVHLSHQVENPGLFIHSLLNTHQPRLPARPCRFLECLPYDEVEGQSAELAGKLASFAETLFDSHVAALRAHYGARRDAMLAALAREMPEGVEWTRPEGGMFVWVTMPEAMDGAALLERAIAEERVAFVPGSAFFADGTGRNTLRLNFSSPDEAVIDEGIARLGRCIARQRA